MQSHGGPADYILFVDGKALGIVEAKKEGTTFSAVAEQSARYTADVIGKVIVLLRMYVLRSQKKSLLAAEDAKEKSRRRGNDSSQPVPISPLSALSSQISLVGV
jgi:type I site-specific restriction endonuclease